MTQLEFNHKVSRESRPLKGYAFRLTQNTDDAEDLVQDTMLKAFMNRDKFQDGTNLKGWLYTIMKNIFINKYRRARKSNIVTDDTDNQYYINNAATSMKNGGEGKMVMQEIKRAIASISENLSTPFMMSYTGYKYEEIADHLKLPLGTVKVRIHNARHELQKKLAAYGTNKSFLAS
ncbi:MAG: hypothetical protein RIQ89_575 [Bacteroidota bacterium]|jgi:RNA polymerase sigma factor (sigma-70 family)